LNPIVIIQARMGSTRLPGKILLPFWNHKSILDLILENITSVVPASKIVIATSINPKDNAIVARYAKDFVVFRGDEQDVLSRFLGVLKKTGAESFLRVCADNPFLLSNEIDRLIKYPKKEFIDYVSYKIDGQPSIKTHCGFFAEYATNSSLIKQDLKCKEIKIREHVTNYIYTSDGFSTKWIMDFDKIKVLSNIRLTIDREDDFRLAQEIYREIKANRIEMAVVPIAEFVSSNAQWMERMRSNIASNSK
jgi:spore coat polysaccharide biosynthesis protein SpsF (cytidylyltransferase family)